MKRGPAAQPTGPFSFPAHGVPALTPRSFHTFFWTFLSDLLNSVSGITPKILKGSYDCRLFCSLQVIASLGLAQEMQLSLRSYVSF